MGTTKPFRFLAGSRCPSCEKPDCLQIRRSPAGADLRCVECGYQETLSNQTPPTDLPVKVLDDTARPAN